MSEKVNIEQMRRVLQGNATPKQPIASMQKGKDGQIDVTDEVVDILTKPVMAKVVDEVKPKLVEVISQGLEAEAVRLRSDIDAGITASKALAEKNAKSLKDNAEKLSADLLALATQVRPIEIRTEHNSIPMSGVQHEKFELLLRIVGANLPVLMVGPAGTGKTQGAEQVAKALGFDFYAISVGSQTSKSDIFGYKDAAGQFHETAFYQAYVNGGIFLLDEADAGNANVLVGLNAALSNGYVFFPNGVMTKMHENFRMIATANTFGNGASRQYVGRNQLDAATLDRFTVITWDIDDQIEKAISEVSPTYGARWLYVVKAVRTEAIDKMELRAVVSPRATLRGAKLLESGVTYEDAVQVALIANLPEAERDALLNIANAAWAKGEPKKAKTPSKAKAPEFDIDGLVDVYSQAEEA